jgi:predicted P-loop ATPase
MMPEIALAPDPAQIRAHLQHITRRWGELHTPATLEIVFLTPHDAAEVRHVARFGWDANGIEEAVALISSMNGHKLNAYATVNPVNATMPLRAGKRANGDEIIGSFYQFADADDAQAAENIRNFVGPKCTFFVLTGKTPTPRPHVYWELDRPEYDLSAWTNRQRMIAQALKTDSVIDPPRIMRLAGTINWPKPKKVEKGYIVELTTLKIYGPDERPPVSADQLQRAFGDVERPALSQRAAPRPPVEGGFYISTGPNDERPSEGEFIEALSFVSPSMGHQQGWLDALMAIHDYFTGDLRGLDVAKEWSSGDPRYSAREVESKWSSFGAGKGVSYRTIFHMARENGADLVALANKHRPRLPQAQRIVPTPEQAPDDAGDWKADLIVNSRGRVLWNTANVLLMMENDPNLTGCFAFDEFRQVKMLTRPLPLSGERADRFQGREIKDSDTTKLLAYFNRIGFPDATKNVVVDAIEAICEAATFHPIRNYLHALPDWDGVPRLSDWLFDYCAVEALDDDHAEYIRAVGRKWLISAVARVMRPGSKADGVLILEGRQGARKSSTLRCIFGAEWFGDSLPPMQSKDASDYLRGKWVVEMAELSNMNKAEVEVVKAFIAREEERFRPAYARNELSYPRQCVFAGTTNKTDYLRDETGNRRFWPVKVGHICDTTSLQRDRNLIWSEALHAFNAGEEWWLTGEAERAAEVQQQARVAQDAWEGDVLQYLVGRSEASPAAIAKDVLEIEVGRVDRAVTNRITSILTSNGWSRSGQFTSGIDKGRARYVRDDA